jgi:hypothetical protein
MRPRQMQLVHAHAVLCCAALQLLGLGSGVYNSSTAELNLEDPPLRDTLTVARGGWAALRFLVSVNLRPSFLSTTRNPSRQRCSVARGRRGRGPLILAAHGTGILNAAASCVAPLSSAAL